MCVCWARCARHGRLRPGPQHFVHEVGCVARQKRKKRGKSVRERKRERECVCVCVCVCVSVCVLVAVAQARRIFAHYVWSVMKQ